MLETWNVVKQSNQGCEHNHDHRQQPTTDHEREERRERERHTHCEIHTFKPIITKLFNITFVSDCW